tara:strand:- start:15705 stop:16124 length:420 start_codon:yes stop_codon:yes gene_type:complete
MSAATQRRKQIRDEVQGRLSAALSGFAPVEVFSQQRFALRDGTRNCASVFFTEGEVETDLSERTDRGQLAIRVATRVSLAVDDQLDAMVDAVEQALDAEPLLGGLVSSLLQSDWAYGVDEQTGFAWQALAYRIRFETDR